MGFFIANILAKNPISEVSELQNDLLVEPAEIALARSLANVEERIKPLLKQSDYKNTLTTLAELKEPIDDFFENVMVVAEDENERANNLRLLLQIRDTARQIADFDRISG